MKGFRLVALIITIVFSMVIFSACTSDIDGVCFGTSYQLSLEGKGANKLSKSFPDLLNKLENNLSVSINASDIYKINAARAEEAVYVSEHSMHLIKASKEMFEKTNGQFNPAIFPITKLWGLDTEHYTTTKESIPSSLSIAESLVYCSMDCFVINEENLSVTKTDDRAQLDLGGIAKGYAVDLLSAKCIDLDSYLINIGGEISVGKKEKKIGIASPFTPNENLYWTPIMNMCIATSGTYERYFVYDNKEYNHIIDKTGYPSTTNVVSVTVIAQGAMLCDMLATVGVLVDYATFSALLQNYSASAQIIYSDKTSATIGNATFNSIDE